MSLCSYCGRDATPLRPLDDNCASCRVRSHIARSPLGITTSKLLEDTGLRIEAFCELANTLRRQGRITSELRYTCSVWVGL